MYRSGLTAARKTTLGTIAALTFVGALAIPHSAQAWWHRGWGWGPAIIVAPPLFYAPPVYAAPPLAYYSRPAGQACYAGPYVCPLDPPGPQGARCSCPTNGNHRAGGHIG